MASIVAQQRHPRMTSTMPPTRYRFHRPVSLMIRPVTMLETSSPPTIAIDISPASVGDMPRAIWKYWREVDGRAEHGHADQHRRGGGQRGGPVA